MRIACSLAIAFALSFTRAAHAQCVYVTGAAPLGTHSTEVVLVRDAGITTMTIASRYDGPAQPFAMVVPVVDGAITSADVMPVSSEASLAIAVEDAPRLVEYWEQDPCGKYEEHSPAKRTGPKVASRPADRARDAGGAPPTVAQAQAEYETVVTSGDVTQWLMSQGYVVGADTAATLGRLTNANATFVVAKVDPTKLRLESGHASLAPLRVRFASPSFGLRVLAEGDLVVHALGKRQRYEAVNRRDESIPTNLDVRATTKDDFDSAYDALLSDVATRVPDIVVTEYAWSLDGCDPCTGPMLSSKDKATLGADTTDDWVVTRLHLKNARGELLLGPAPPIAGGREFRDGTGAIERGTRVSASNQFQARYAIRHPWAGPIVCDHPSRDRWGPPPQSGIPAPVVAHPLASSSSPPAPSWFASPFDVDAAPTAPVSAPLQLTRGAPAPASGCNVGGSETFPCWAPIVAWLARRRRREIVS